MEKEVKQKRFIEKAIKKHNNKYDYNKVDYIDVNTPVCIICPEHGEFWQKPCNHLSSKYGCPKCGKKEMAKTHILTTEKFIEHAKKIHGDKYDYSKVKYKGINEKVCIICPEHGEFWQTPIQHFKGSNCCECGKTPSLTTEKFILKARQVHGWKYDYSKVNYVNSKTKVCIICPEHGEFWQLPNSHLNGKYGCIKCALKSLRYTSEEFIRKARQVHGNKYDYSKVEYIDINTPVCIICPEHGEFYQKPTNHLKGCGCQKCNKKNIKYTYDYCYSTALKYKTFYDFRKNDYRTYLNAKENNWIKDYTWIEEVQYEDLKRQVVYVYEFSDNSAYVGLTNNIQRRDLEHRDLKKLKKDTVLDYSIKNNIEIPEVKILKQNLTRKESQIEEIRYIEIYKKNGWKLLNKVKGGSLGSVFCKNKWTRENVIEVSKKYKNQEEMKKFSRTWYNRMIKMNLTKECFPNGRFLDSTNMKNQYVYTEKFLNEIKQKYPLKKDLRKNEFRVYRWLWKNDRLYEFYPD